MIDRGLRILRPSEEPEAHPGGWGGTGSITGPNSTRLCPSLSLKLLHLRDLAVVGAINWTAQTGGSHWWLR